MTYTAAPWRLEYDDNGFYYIMGENCPSPYIVATASDGEENRANATLIALAPELVRLLKLCVENIQGIADGNDLPSITLRDHARDTIRKAKEGI